MIKPILRFFSVFFYMLIIFGTYKYYMHSIRPPVLPEPWWGPGSAETADNSIRPFKISWSDQLIYDLKIRLKNTRPMVPALKSKGWSYGMDGSYVATITDYWRTKYNFREREAHLNKYPQFTTNIQGLKIHFLHVKPKRTGGKRVLPLLLQHGWPGSVVEFYKMLPMLTTPRDGYDFVFEVIAPSLPGFGYSSAAIRPGLGSPQIAVVLKNLMLRLGFPRFYYQGGDWGAITGANLAILFPQHVLGLHSNMCTDLSASSMIKWYLYGYWPSLLLPKEHQSLMFPARKKLYDLIEQSGYFHIQATKPDTVGVGLSDSPAALAAYILEKFSAVTGPDNVFQKDGGLSIHYNYDELIDNLMMYWAPNSATTAMRIYAETYISSNRNLNFEAMKVYVPTACAQFPYEIFYQPMSFLKNRYKNLLRATLMPRGGHFAALEEPELLSDDVWVSIAEMESIRKRNKRLQHKNIKQMLGEL